MDTHHATSHDLLHDEAYAPLPYSPLPDHPVPAGAPALGQRRPLKVFAVTLASLMFLASLVALVIHQSPQTPVTVDNDGPSMEWEGRGVAQGVSEKSFLGFSGRRLSYNWTTAMFAWQRTAFHFQPEKNWMNDPDGPLFHMGWYHLFYQYNPDSAVWGNITWGHAVSRDMIHWLYLPLAMVPDRWFDLNGVWTGSATILPNGQIIMLYTGDTNDSVQVQNLAYPANLSDPLLLHWIKYENNPVMVPPAGIASDDFRDPTTMWVGADGNWRVAVGSLVNTTGIVLVFQTTNFTDFEQLDGVLHGVPGTGMWECVDFYPVSINGVYGLDTSAHGPGIKHVLKASMDDNRHDYYALGEYDPMTDTWTPDDPELDVGIGLRLDYGKYYASKTFYDQVKKRRILYGWISEGDIESDDLKKGWASLQSIPRTVLHDNKTGTYLLLWPIEEVESLRTNSTEFEDVLLEPGSIVPLDIGSASQLDIVAEFEVDNETLEAMVEADVIYNCSTSAGAAGRGALGPFGILVLADDTLSELTPIYFYIAKDTDGSYKTFFCTDLSRSSLAVDDVDQRIYGSIVPVLDDEKPTMRVLVDHSIVEGFSQGGRSCITTRVYPTEAIYGAARLFLFNNATGVNVTASIKIWEMASADIHPYPLDQP